MKLYATIEYTTLLCMLSVTACGARVATDDEPLVGQVPEP